MPSARILSAVDWMRLIQEHGGIVGQAAAKTSAASDNPLLGGATGAESGSQIIQFGDGTSITVHANIQSGGNGQIVVDDWGSLGTTLDAQAKQTASKQLSPEDQRIQQQTIESNDLSIAKQRRDLQTQNKGAMQSAFEDAQATIDYIQSQMAAGRMTAAEANKAISQVQSSLESQVYGATPYQRTQADRDYQTNRAQIGTSLFNQRISSGTSIANELLGNTMDAVKMGVGPGDFNPFALSKSFVTDLGGGQATYDTASAMLQGASQPIQQPSMDELSPGYWFGTPEMPGDPGVSNDLDPYPGAAMPFGSTEPYDPLRYPGGY